MSEPNVTVVSSPRARMNVKTVTSLGMLTAVAYILMLLSKMLPQVYTFLQLDVQATAITIGGFLFGPLAAATISVVLPVIEMLTVSDTGPIGCIMNVLATASFCCTAAFVYKKMHTKKGAVAGLTLAHCVPALQPGQGRAEHGPHSGALQARGHRAAPGQAGAGVPNHCGEQALQRRVPAVLPGGAGHLRDHRPGAHGHHLIFCPYPFLSERGGVFRHAASFLFGDVADFMQGPGSVPAPLPKPWRFRESGRRQSPAPAESRPQSQNYGWQTARLGTSCFSLFSNENRCAIIGKTSAGEEDRPWTA